MIDLIRLNKELAVIGATNELLRQHMEPAINFDVVCEYTRMLETRSGYAVLHGFTEESLQQFLREHKNLFQYDYAKTVLTGKPTYRLSVVPMDEHQIKAFVGNMMDCLDPAINYPIDFLEDMRLMDVL